MWYFMIMKINIQNGLKMNSCAEANDGACPQNKTCTALQDGRALTWVEIAGRYPAPRDCLAAFIAASAAEVLAGVKPANLIRIVNRRLPCGRSLYGLWQTYGQDLLAESSLSVTVMREDPEAVLLLLYDDALLGQRFRSLTMQAFLKNNGCIAADSLEKALACLRKAFGSGVPHEIGAFLGYPLKDVRGFINRTGQPFAGQGMWRIYGPPTRSLRLDDLYRQKRRAMLDRLLTQQAPLELLQAA